MPLNNRGQISIETLVGVVIVFLLFIVVIAYNNFVGDSSVALAFTLQTKSECLGLSEIITRVYSSGDGSEANYSIEFDANILGKERLVIIGQESCTFLANSSTAFLPKGNYVLKNLDGNVIISA
jgi:hypothetical protein